MESKSKSLENVMTILFKNNEKQKTIAKEILSFLRTSGTVARRAIGKPVLREKIKEISNKYSLSEQTVYKIIHKLEKYELIIYNKPNYELGTFVPVKEMIEEWNEFLRVGIKHND